MNTKNIIVAFASDDNKNLSKNHFGEAKKYLIYEISESSFSKIKTIENTSPEEKMHGNPNKSKGVAAILKPNGVKVIVNKAFGRNLSRMQQKFVCIISSIPEINKNIAKIQENFNTIFTELKKGEDRNFLRF